MIFFKKLGQGNREKGVGVRMWYERLLMRTPGWMLRPRWLSFQNLEEESEWITDLSG